MKITIDTKEDSHHDIKKVISLLNHLISSSDEPTYSNQPRNIFEDGSAFEGSIQSNQTESQPQPAGGIFNMFDSSEPAQSSDDSDKDDEPEDDKPVSIQVVEY